MSYATIATLPRWMRRLGGYDQPVVLDRAVTPFARTAMLISRAPRIQLAVLAAGGLPATRRVLEQHLHGEPPLHPETTTPGAARELRSAVSRQVS
jgi:hypothetical protein